MQHGCWKRLQERPRHDGLRLLDDVEQRRRTPLTTAARRPAIRSTCRGRRRPPIAQSLSRVPRGLQTRRTVVLNVKNPPKIEKKSWNGLVILVPATVWQVFNMRQRPETEIKWICWNLIWNFKKLVKSHQVNLFLVGFSDLKPQCGGSAGAPLRPPRPPHGLCSLAWIAIEGHFSVDSHCEQSETSYNQRLIY